MVNMSLKNKDTSSKRRDPIILLLSVLSHKNRILDFTAAKTTKHKFTLKTFLILYGKGC